MANLTDQGKIVALALRLFPRAPRGETVSLATRLVRRWPLGEVEVMLHGAARLGWTSLRGLCGKEGVGRRWAQEAYWRQQNQRPANVLESLGRVLHQKGLVP